MTISARILGALGLALMVAACGGPVVDVGSDENPNQPIDRFENAQVGKRAVHAIGVYEASAAQEQRHEREDIVVDLREEDPSRSLYLALSAYEPVNWVVTGPGAALVRGVYLDGRGRQTVEGIDPSVRVYDRSGAPDIPPPFIDKNMGPDRGIKSKADEEWGAASTEVRDERVPCALTQTGGLRDCDRGELFLQKAQEILKAPVTTFTGIVNAQRFTVAALPKIESDAGEAPVEDDAD